MHPLTLFKVVGLVLIVLGIAEILPATTSALYGDADSRGLLVSALGALIVGALMYGVGRKARELSNRDGFVVVTVVWATACLAGAVPFLLTYPQHSVIDALFESVSGFTTTGASIEVDYESLSHGILLWRSMSQWFGGMGIVLFALAILPTLGVAGMQLFKREVPGPYSEKITPRLRDTALALWSVYLILTAVEAVVLSLFGMPVFDAVNYAMATISTGGFGTQGTSLMAYQSAAIEWTVIVFMFLAGMSFALHFRMLGRRPGRFGYFGDVEWKAYATATVAICAAVVVYLWLAKGYSAEQAITKGAFQVVSILTTTGFASDDYVAWGPFPQYLLLFCMLAGGCAGSTSGGIKWVRMVIIVRGIYIDMLQILHPRLVSQVRINQVPVTERIHSNVSSFVVLFLATIGVLTVLISVDLNSMSEALGAAISAVGNIGPALGELGPNGNYAGLSTYVKSLLLTGMLLGRLELLTVFMVFLPHLWRF